MFLHRVAALGTLDPLWFMLHSYRQLLWPLSQVHHDCGGCLVSQLPLERAIDPSAHAARRKRDRCGLVNDGAWAARGHELDTPAELGPSLITNVLDCEDSAASASQAYRTHANEAHHSEG